MKNSSSYFCNVECEYYPCHKLKGDFNCLFCYCPLHSLRDCGGNYEILSNGVKDCSNCVFPHIPENYYFVIERLAKECFIFS